jgi:hypothetical protein
MSSPLSGISKKVFAGLRKTLRTDKLIAEHYGVTRQAIFNLRKKLDIPPTRTPDSLEKRNVLICKDFKKNLSALTIAEKYKITLVYVYALKRKHFIR